MYLIVDISDAKISADPEQTLATYSLGSCIAVALYDPKLRLGGMVHYQLPVASLNPAKAKDKPFMFADTGMQLLLDRICAMGAQKSRLRVSLAGGAQLMDENSLFNIGRRNHAAARKFFWAHGLFVEFEEVGGTSPRNLYLDIKDGSVRIMAAAQAQREETHGLQHSHRG